MQMLYGYDVAADLAPQTRYDEVVTALGGGGETVTDPTADRPGARPRVRRRRAVPRQRHHRRRTRPTRAPPSASERRDGHRPARAHRRARGGRRAHRRGVRRDGLRARGRPLRRPPARRGDPGPRGRGLRRAWSDGELAGHRDVLPAGVAVERGRPAGRGRVPDARGRARRSGGAASREALVGVCLERSRELGYTAVVLCSLPAQARAHRIYERLGFRRLPERDWSPDPGVDLMAFRLAL